VDKKIIHEIGNYLYQLISYAEYISRKSDSSEIYEYAQKIKRDAYRIDALISDSTTKKEYVDVSKGSLNSIDFEELRDMKVMIVDDLDVNIQIIKNTFEMFSDEIKSAKSGEEALELYKNGFHPDFICMDIIMPGIGGVETTKKLKDLGCNAYFIAVSALKNQPNEIVSVFDYWLNKPFGINDIICALSGYKPINKEQTKEEKFLYRLDLSPEIKNELLEYAKSGSYTSLKRLTKTLPQSDSKKFLIDALERMNFDSIIKSIISS
jgi:CheY-like chemotaxis protein